MQQLHTIDDYRRLVVKLKECEAFEKQQIIRYLCRTDLFFLLWFALGRNDIAHPWLLERCKEVQAEPNGYLDLWAREHYKSTIITFAKTIQDILASHGEDPLPEWKGIEPTFGIFSFTRPIAKGFLRQIKREFESNEILRENFSDIIWELPHKEAPKWSEDDGIILKRKGNPKESTIEAWGVVEAQPTSKHFDVLVYDDMVTVENISTPDMIEKTTNAWALSQALGKEGGFQRYIGTRYHYNDSYREMIKRGSVKLRLHAITEDGTPEGKPVLMKPETVVKKRRDMGPYIFSCQMLQNPIGDERQNFKKEWVRWHSGSSGEGLNKYIIVDPANEKKKSSDYTAIAVIGLGADNNYYLLDGIRDRLNLTERADHLFKLVRKWRPMKVGYEQYGMQADISHIKERMGRENYHFTIQELGGKLAKNDRIKTLIPSFSQGRWLFPESLFKTNYEGKTIDLIDVFINEEYLPFPVPVHDDFFDCIARITDPEFQIIWPRQDDDNEHNDRYSRRRTANSGSSWAA